MEDPDHFESKAQDLEDAQSKRFRKSTQKSNFWKPTEVMIFDEIKMLRSQSETYHSDNLR